MIFSNLNKFILFNNQYSKKKTEQISLTTNNPIFESSETKDYLVTFQEALPSVPYIICLTGNGNNQIIQKEKEGRTYYCVVNILTGNGDNTIFLKSIYAGNIQTGSGNDYVTINHSSYHVTGTLGSGKDHLCIGNISCDFEMGDGDDYIKINVSNSKPANKTVYIDGGNDNDIFEIFTAGKGIIKGGAGDDFFEIQIICLAELQGGAGNDTFVIKGRGGVSIKGEDGDDIFLIYQDSGTSNIEGGNGNDSFKYQFGSTNHDFTLTISGGLGADRFYFHENMQITDLNFTEGDQVVFSVDDPYYRDRMSKFLKHYADANIGQYKLYISEKYIVYGKKGLLNSDIFDKNGNLQSISSHKLVNSTLLARKTTGQLFG